jgi:hypothetical protein
MFSSATNFRSVIAGIQTGSWVVASFLFFAINGSTASASLIEFPGQDPSIRTVPFVEPTEYSSGAGKALADDESRGSRVGSLFDALQYLDSSVCDIALFASTGSDPGTGGKTVQARSLSGPMAFTVRDSDLSDPRRLMGRLNRAKRLVAPQMSPFELFRPPQVAVLG